MKLIDDIIRRPVAVAFATRRGGALQVSQDPDRVSLSLNGVPVEIDGASGTLAGVLSAADKAKLDGLAAGQGQGGQVVRVDTLAEAKALNGLVPGKIVYVGDDEFVVVDDASLGADGATVLIPDQHLSAYVEETIAPSYFNDAYYGALYSKSKALLHGGIDLESVECVLTDGGEKITGWQLHGHRMNTQAEFATNGTPYVPLIDVDAGLFRDPSQKLTHSSVSTRTGGMLLRYRHATNGIRLKRTIRGGALDLRWWGVTPNDAGVDDTDRIAWAMTRAWQLGARSLYVHDFYSYRRTIEIPSDVLIHGRGIGKSGFRLMNGAGYEELKLSKGTANDPTKFPLASAATAQDRYLNRLTGYTQTLFGATGGRRFHLRDIEIDGNYQNNLGIWQNHADYAWSYLKSSSYLFNAPVYNGLSFSNHGARNWDAGAEVHLHNVKIHGFGGNILLGNDKVKVRSTGVLEIGNSLHNHLMYTVDGTYERLRTFGFHWGDGIRSRQMHVRDLEASPARFPDVMYDNEAAVGYTAATAMMSPISHVETAAQALPSTHATMQVPPHRLIIDWLTYDLTQMDNLNGRAVTPVAPFFLGGDNIQIKGRVRMPANGVSYVIRTYGNGLQYGPYKNVEVSLHVEHRSRTAPPALFATNSSNTMGWAKATFSVVQESMGDSMLPENAGPDGKYYILGSQELDGDTDNLGPYALDFSGVTAAGIGGRHFDVTPPDTGAPVFRVWFDVANGSTAPSGSGVTLIEVDITSSETAANIARKAADAIRANATAYAYLTVGWHPVTHSGRLVLGSYSRFRLPAQSAPTISLVGIPGVTSTRLSSHRYYEPLEWAFRDSQWNDPTAIGIINLTSTPAAHADLRLMFSRCVLGAHSLSRISASNGGNLASASVIAWKDRVKALFTDCVIDLRVPPTGQGFAYWNNLDLTLYASRFLRTRARTGDAALGDDLWSEDQGEFAWTADGASTFVDIPTKLFWAPKVYRVDAGNAATAAHMRGSDVFVSLRRNGGQAFGGTGAYYQGPDGVSEDRRAPRLRVNLGAAPAAGTAMLFRWQGAVSP